MIYDVYIMYVVGEKIIYGESGVCTVDVIAPSKMTGADPSRLYYYLSPMVGTGVFSIPVESSVFTRPVIDKATAEALIESIPDIEPAICNDSRFNHVDAFYKELFKQHTPEALVAIIKGLTIKMSEKKTKSSRAEITMKRAKEILYAELAVALSIPYAEVEQYLKSRTTM